jgi:hypothetical protein
MNALRFIGHIFCRAVVCPFIGHDWKDKSQCPRCLTFVSKWEAWKDVVR